jgi:tRNA (adenine57-N1/adenine58-N1)-methyltransferase
MEPRQFAPGEIALLLDAEGNRHLVRLAESGAVHHHLGMVRHADIIGRVEGDVVRSNQGQPFVVVRPRLVDYVLGGMPRRSGIVYPKDAAQITVWADIAPGLRVLEAGVGSGALTIALLRAVGERGEVIGYEQRADFIELALSNVRAFTGWTAGNLLLRERDIYEGIVDRDLDRVVLDLPEPWRVLPHVRGALRPGGWVCAYTPSILQVCQFVEALHAERRFLQVEVQEVLLRPWHVKGLAVRPEQQIIGHTGFITVARMVADGAGISQDA